MKNRLVLAHSKIKHSSEYFWNDSHIHERLTLNKPQQEVILVTKLVSDIKQFELHNHLLNEEVNISEWVSSSVSVMLYGIIC